MSFSGFLCFFSAWTTGWAAQGLLLGRMWPTDHQLRLIVANCINDMVSPLSAAAYSQLCHNVRLLSQYTVCLCVTGRVVLCLRKRLGRRYLFRQSPFNFCSSWQKQHEQKKSSGRWTPQKHAPTQIKWHGHMFSLSKLKNEISRG